MDQEERNLIHVEYHFVTQHDNLDDECQLSSVSLTCMCDYERDSIMYLCMNGKIGITTSFSLSLYLYLPPPFFFSFYFLLLFFIMPTIREWIKRHSFTIKKEQKSKSVRFLSNSDVYYTHSSLDYDRRSSIDSFITTTEADCLKTFITEESIESEFDEQVIRNTKVNKKQGYHSIAVLVNYRANI